MVGLLYLPRLFVYHVGSEVGSTESETFKVMARKLSLFIMVPAMIATWIFGLWLIALVPEWMQDGWLHVKLLAVVAISAFHMITARWRKALANDVRDKSSRFFRIANEVPTVLLILIVIMASVKPF
ncbi:MAG: CopD family protein [Pseudomonadota bacterium]